MNGTTLAKSSGPDDTNISTIIAVAVVVVVVVVVVFSPLNFFPHLLAPACSC